MWSIYAQRYSKDGVGMFRVQDLRFRYPHNSEDTIRGMSFDVKDGEIFGLLGPSGVGKSTTQKIMIKLLKNYQGKVEYRGRDLRSYGKEFYENIGVGFEMPVHFSRLTAEENIRFFKGLYRKHADTDSIMKRLGLYKDRDKKIAAFSKGMKVRMNFVRALLNDPEVLILDEPTNGLDPTNARIVKDMIREFKEAGGTVLLTTHLMGDVDELCDRVAFMANGNIAECAEPKTLKIKYGSREVMVEYEGDTAEKKSFSLDTLGENEEFFEIVRTKKIITMHSSETTLDDIFIKVTGGAHNE
jgi:fluoroquinolone transport system ATP-binding protein